MRYLILFLAVLCLGFSSYVPSEFETIDRPQWQQLEQSILQTNDTEIVLYWRGIGGRTDMMNEFTDVLYKAQRQGKSVLLKIIGPTISAHADVVCHMPYEFDVHTYLVFHNATTNSGQYDDSYTRSLLDQCRQFVTQDEENSIINNHIRMEYWYDGSKVFKPEY